MNQPQVSRTSGALQNLPNILTLFRIAAIPALVLLLRDPSTAAAALSFTVFLIASLTDIADGWVARRYGLVTPLGKLLDPLADKLLVVSALIMLALMDRQPGIPDWLLVLIVGRELAVTGLRSIAAAEGIVLGAETSGKVKMILQAVGIHALILHYTYFGISFHTLGIWLLVLSTIFGVGSAIQYHLLVFRTLSGRRT
ncbi:MAG: CDP-diacylglycerol--glycerol-3-phosphate 3-phosphatidyltransferase [Hyphomicrobiaceae bacterium]|jgi:CDP-diacylglycerol--glycerol-3-phosphate 3-phosphatidyltransferase